jgi:hypothetical protein
MLASGRLGLDLLSLLAVHWDSCTNETGLRRNRTAPEHVARCRGGAGPRSTQRRHHHLWLWITEGERLSRDCLRLQPPREWICRGKQVRIGAIIAAVTLGGCASTTELGNSFSVAVTAFGSGITASNQLVLDLQKDFARKSEQLEYVSRGSCSYLNPRDPEVRRIVLHGAGSAREKAASGACVGAALSAVVLFAITARIISSLGASDGGELQVLLAFALVAIGTAVGAYSAWRAARSPG